MPHRVLLLGAGKIGQAIASFLSHTGEYEVTVADAFAEPLERLAVIVPDAGTLRIDVEDRAALDAALADQRAVISALSFTHNVPVADAALASGASYFDLTEDVTTTHAVMDIAARAADGQVFMPQCGLAPGFIGIVGHHLTKQFDELDTCRMRVGALPKFPSNMLKYNLTWSTDGLINEYCNPCEAIVRHEKTLVQALEGVETFSMDGVLYEAFNTSGGLGTLCDTLEGRCRTLDYKTIRYVGHRQLAQFLINELRMRDDRANLRMILERAVPMTTQDVVIVFVTATGMKGGRLMQLTDARKVYNGNLHGHEWSAIQITTAAGICAAVDLHLQGKLGVQRGFARQEQVRLPDFLKNRFGQYYALGTHDGIKVEEIEGHIENEPA